MKRILPNCVIILFLLVTGSAQLLSQNRVEYLDQYFNVQASADKAKYVRDVKMNTDSTYFVTVSYITGELIMQGLFLDKALETENGPFKYFYANGNPESSGNFKNGQKVGTWKRWNFDGKPKPDRFYNDEKFVATTRATSGAKFPGGMAALQKLVSDSLKYPLEAKERGIEGTVYITFIVDASGEVRLPQVSDGVHYLLDEEALRFVSSLPLWTPAAKNGIAVDSSYIMPITFDLDNDTLQNRNEGLGTGGKN